MNIDGMASACLDVLNSRGTFEMLPPVRYTHSIGQLLLDGSVSVCKKELKYDILRAIVKFPGLLSNTFHATGEIMNMPSAIESNELRAKLSGGERMLQDIRGFL